MNSLLAARRRNQNWPLLVNARWTDYFVTNELTQSDTAVAEAEMRIKHFSQGPLDG